MTMRTAFILTFILFAVSAQADELVLFSAATSGPDVWSWGKAQIVQQADGTFLVR